MKRKGPLRYYAEGDVLRVLIKAGEEAREVGAQWAQNRWMRYNSGGRCEI
jgi:hypothetical protein